MAFREVSVVEIKEILRLWLAGRSGRSIHRLLGVHRDTVRSYLEAAERAGLRRDGGDDQLTDGLIGQVLDAVRPPRTGTHGEAWAFLESHRVKLKARVDADLKLTKIHDLLARETGVSVPYATLHRFAQTELGFGRKKTTVRLADGEPGGELQVDFARMGLVADPETGRRRMCHALICTSSWSRHVFVFLTFRQSLEAVIEGFERAWSFFGGVFAVVIPDNMRAIVADPNDVSPRFNDAFLEYAQSRGFTIDPARVRHPRDKARVERIVQYVRESFFRGETFLDLDDANERAVRWCLEVAGLRIHRTTQVRPLEAFRREEQPKLLPAPSEPYDLPIYQRAKVHRDYHIEVARSLYSVPEAFIGCWVDVRADSRLVRIFHKGRLVKEHPRTHRGGRSTDTNDLPADRRDYAMRSVDQLLQQGDAAGAAVGEYARRIIDTPQPWMRIRQVYRLLGLVRRHGAERADRACAAALELDVVDVTRIGRMLERGLEQVTSGEASAGAAQAQVLDLRFARDPAEWKTGSAT